MSTLSVYSFADANQITRYVDENDFNYTGTWSSTGTYVASTLDTANYASALYICIRDTIGANPLTNPNYWSIMSLLYSYQGQSSGSNAVADEAYALAVSGTNIAWAAYQMAQIGTNTGSAAYTLAESAFSVAVAGTTAAASAHALAQAGSNLAWAAYSGLPMGGSADPRVIGINAPIYSIYSQVVDNELVRVFVKVGATGTDWN